MKDIRGFKGVIPAVLSVFDRDENLDEAGTRQFIRHLLSYDIGGLYLTGSTGETFLMDSAERMRQLEIVMEVPYDQEGSAIGVCKGNEGLLAAVNASIAKAIEDGSMERFVAEANEQASGEKYEGLLNESGQVQE